MNGTVIHSLKVPSKNHARRLRYWRRYNSIIEEEFKG